MPSLKDYYKTEGITEDKLIAEYMLDIKDVFDAIGFPEVFERKYNDFLNRCKKDLNDGDSDFDDAFETKTGLTIFKISYDAIYKSAKTGNQAWEKALRKYMGIKKKKKKGFLRKIANTVEKIGEKAGDILTDPKTLAAAAAAVATGGVAGVAIAAGGAISSGIEKGKKAKGEFEKVKGQLNKEITQADLLIKKEYDNFMQDIDNFSLSDQHYVQELKNKFDSGLISEQTFKQEFEQFKNPPDFISQIKNFFTKLFGG